MKKIILLFFILNLINCKSKNEFEGQFISAMEMTTLDVNGNSVNFNIGYTVEFEKTENQNCLVETKDELNSMLIEPLIRSEVRSFIGQLDNNGIESINKEDIKRKINNELSEVNVSLNTKKFTNCFLKISMFAITRRK